MWKKTLDEAKSTKHFTFIGWMPTESEVLSLTQQLLRLYYLWLKNIQPNENEYPQWNKTSNMMSIMSKLWCRTDSSVEFSSTNNHNYLCTLIGILQRRTLGICSRYVSIFPIGEMLRLEKDGKGGIHHKLEITGYDPVWSCMVPNGPLWLSMDPYGPVWSLMV